MPFNYKEFSAKCDGMTVEQLNNEWNIYTRHISGGATSTAMSVGFAPFTLGASLLGLGLATPRIHNTRKKRVIIEAHLQAKGTTHDTRKRDVMGFMALSGTIGGLTLGLAPPGAEAVGTLGAEHAIAAIAMNPHTVEAVAHGVFDGVGFVAEQGMERRHEHSKEKKALKQLRKMASAQNLPTETVAPPSFVMNEKKDAGITVIAVEKDLSDDEDMSMEEMEELLKQVMASKRKLEVHHIVRSRY